MTSAPVLSCLVLAGLCLLLSACGGGGGGGGGGNTAPTASFTASPTTGQAPLTVAFDASASSDPDGSIASYAWSFGDNSTGSGVTASHTYATAGTYTATLTVTDNGGAKGTATRTISATVGPPPTSVTVSGKITYERVPFATTLDAGLDYGRITAMPARGIVVELLKSDKSILASTATDANGNYTFTAPASTDVIVRAKAESRSTGSTTQPATWDISVEDNTNGNALYVMDSAAFNTGVANVTKNLLADSGWQGFGSTSYSGPRVAAPFAILDTFYSAVQFLANDADHSIHLPALQAFWSPENKSSTNFNPTTGEIQTTAYQTGVNPYQDGIYILGTDGVDTDEYDEHVLAHEFDHYLNAQISRDDTIGGDHSLGEKLDMRVAFSEGFANAFSGMVLNDPVYRDSYGTAQSQDFNFNVESNANSPAGWFNEGSVQSIVWDLYDSTADAGDNVALGFQPMYSVLVNSLRDGVPLTSIFSFITALEAEAGAPVSAINTLVAQQSIVAGTIDAYGSTETNDGGNMDALPLYTSIALGGTKTVCTNIADGTYNKIGNRRFLRFNVPSAQSVTITVTSNDSGTPTPDPDFILYQGRSFTIAETGTPRTEQLVKSLTAGDYVLEVYDYSSVDQSTSAARRTSTCMDVTIN